jgi:SAM-dependent methyltransferase
MAEMSPTPADTILDVGVADTGWRLSNFLEALYPWPGRITAVGLQPMPTFERLFPDVRFVAADGLNLPFPDDCFDIGFSNAVVEHVGSRADQTRFVHELVRTCRRVFVATPNAAFPVDPHTLLPFVHWLPRSARHRVLRLSGNSRWATEAALNPLAANELRALFPHDVSVRIARQRLLGLTTVLIAIAERRSPSASRGSEAASPGRP